MSGLDGTGPLEVLRGDPEWSAVFDRAVDALSGKAAPGGDPGKAVAGPETVLETYARAVSGASSPGVSLALTLPMALTVGSVCGQGAFWARVKLSGGGRLDVPMILQSTLIAPSGYGKSTSLDPLVQMVDRLNRDGIGRRGKLIADKHAAVVEVLKKDMPLLEQTELDKIRGIYAAGKCKRLTLDSATPEGVRRALLRGGAVAGILTAEPDILREIAGYAKDGGTFRWLLDGWGGAKIGVGRGDKEMVVPRAVLPYCIVVQPSAFESFNLARADGGGGLAADSAIGRGLYGRSWLVRVEGFAGVGAAYGLNGALAGLGLAGGMSGPGGALAAASGVMEALMVRSDPYRAAMGVCIGWEDAASRDAEGVMDPPVLPKRVWLEIGAGAEWDFGMLQNLRLALIEAVQQMEAVAPGSEQLFMPMATRVTQHVLRLALVLALSVDPGTVDIPGWALRDAGMRLLPWLLEHWALEMHRYQAAAVQALLEVEIKNNTRGDDLTPRGQIISAVRQHLAEQTALSGEDDADADDVVFSRGEIVFLAKCKVRAAARPDLTNPLNGAFTELVAEGSLVAEKQAAAGGKGGKPVVRYRRTQLGKMHGL